MVPAGGNNKRWKVDPAAPTFQEFHKKFDSKYWDKSSVGVPRGIAAVQWGGAEKLDEAVAAGQCQEATEDGDTFYTWKTIKVGHKGGTESGRVLKSGQQNVEAQQYNQIADYFSKMQWRFAYTKEEQQVFIPCVLILDSCSP